MAETASRTRPAIAARDEGRGDTGPAPLRVSYYCRMKPHRVYPWTVIWQQGPNTRRGPDQDVTLRLVIAGAQVVPAEQTINASHAQAKATFFVTPIAKGWLKGQRLEVLVGGRKVQEIPLASKAVSQCRTLILLFLTFFVPWFVWTYFEFPSFMYRQKVLKVDETTHIIRTEKIIKAEGGTEVVAFVKDAVGPPEALKEILPEGVTEVMEKELPKTVGGFYVEFSKTLRENKIGFYSGVLLLILTLFSWFFCRQVSKTVIGRPIPLTAGGADEE